MKCRPEKRNYFYQLTLSVVGHLQVLTLFLDFKFTVINCSRRQGISTLKSLYRLTFVLLAFILCDMGFYFLIFQTQYDCRFYGRRQQPWRRTTLKLILYVCRSLPLGRLIFMVEGYSTYIFVFSLLAIDQESSFIIYQINLEHVMP